MPRVKFIEGFIPGSQLVKWREEYQRKNPEVTTIAIAKILDCDRTALYKMERDEYPITQEQLNQLEQLYGVSLYTIALSVDKTITVELVQNEDS